MIYPLRSHQMTPCGGEEAKVTTVGEGQGQGLIQSEQRGGCSQGYLPGGHWRRGVTRPQQGPPCFPWVTHIVSLGYGS